MKKKIIEKKRSKKIFTIDAYTACYLANDKVLQFLNNVTYKDGFNGNFNLHRIDNPNGIYDNLIMVNLQNPNNMKYMHYGDLYYSEKRKDKKGNVYVWFKIVNKALYTPITPIRKNASILSLMPIITQELNLRLNNVTTCDIACDSYVNFSKKIKKAILDENLLPILNRKPYYDINEKLPELRFSFDTNQVRMNNIAIILKQKTKDGGFDLKGYDKEQEIEVSEKDYIRDWTEMKSVKRIELHLKKEQMKELLKNPLMQKYFDGCDSITSEMLLPYLADSNSDFLENVFYHFLNRLIYFKDKTTGKKITVFDL